MHGETEVKDIHLTKYVMEDLQNEITEGVTLLTRQFQVGHSLSALNNFLRMFLFKTNTKKYHFKFKFILIWEPIHSFPKMIIENYVPNRI